jgi:ABC-type branched-subunit amino acid transport system substrate-binding protein
MKPKVPIGTAEFSSQIAAVRSAQADIVIAKLPAPDAAVLWKQMKVLGYLPKAAFCEECAITDGWFALLGPIAAGTLEADLWSPSLPLPQATTFADRYAAQLGRGETVISHCWSVPTRQRGCCLMLWPLC